MLPVVRVSECSETNMMHELSSTVRSPSRIFGQLVEQIRVLLDVALDDRLIRGAHVLVRVAVMVVADAKEVINLRRVARQQQRGAMPVRSVWKARAITSHMSRA